MSHRSEKKSIKVLIAEDHVSTRFGIKQILSRQFKLSRFGEAGDASQTLEYVRKNGWDLLILDISLPDRSGVELLTEVKRELPELPVLVYSAHKEEDFAWIMLRAGASGYLTKERAPEDLCEAVRHILAGGAYLSKAMSRWLVRSKKAGLVGRLHENLSPREFQALRAIATGKLGKQTAIEMGINEKTVGSYRIRILKKLNMRTTAELIQYAVRERLI